jgi:hypothetical protein
MEIQYNIDMTKITKKELVKGIKSIWNETMSEIYGTSFDNGYYYNNKRARGNQLKLYCGTNIMTMGALGIGYEDIMSKMEVLFTRLRRYLAEHKAHAEVVLSSDDFFIKVNFWGNDGIV